MEEVVGSIPTRSTIPLKKLDGMNVQREAFVSCLCHSQPFLVLTAASPKAGYSAYLSETAWVKGRLELPQLLSPSRPKYTHYGPRPR